MTDIQITIDSSQVGALLAHIQGKLDHLDPAMDSIGYALKENVRLLFRDLKTPEGVAWQQLSAVTRRRRGASAKPLNDKGTLRNSITYSASAYAVEIGTNLPYATTQNFGAKKGQFGSTKWGAPIPWGDIPARQFMPDKHLPIGWENQVIEVIKDHLDIF